MEENVQVEETVGSQVDETANNQVSETPVIEQVGQLLNGNQTTEVEETEQVTPETQVAEPKEVGIINDEMIQQFPTLKMYRGKPLLDLPKAYHNITLAYAENQRKLKQLEKEQAKQKLPDLSKVPDPINEPEKFQSWLVEDRERIRQEALSEVPKPEVNWVSKVQEVLPKEADVDKVLDNFFTFNSERFYNEFGEFNKEVQDFYEKRPQILIAEIQKFYNLSSQAEKNSMTVQNEARNTAYKTITNSIKKSNENKESITKGQINTVQRSVQSTPEDDILASIFNIAQGK